MFELITRDACGRIGRLETAHGSLTTPVLLPVLDPKKLIISPAQLEREFKAQAFITNAYLLWRARKTGPLHKTFSWRKPIMCDSGSYQLLAGLKLELSSADVIKLQEQLTPDIAVFLDIPSGDLPRAAAAKAVSQTIANARECKQLAKAKILWSAGVQGSGHFDLVRRCARALAKLDFDIYAIGSVVPRLSRYEFTSVAEQIIITEQNIPLNRPRHLFGAGHPSSLALAVALGCDIFDCAIYALAAYRNNYLTPHGSYFLPELREFPCACPLCTRAEPAEIIALPEPERERWLARHNLHVSFAELRTIRTAIRENWLWEHVQARARAHPALLAALRYILKKYCKWLIRFELVSKKSAFQWSGEESNYRPEVLRARAWLKRVRGKRYFLKRPFGRVPVELAGVYPFGQSIVPGWTEPKLPKIRHENMIRATLDYQFGRGAGSMLGKFSPEISRRTGRIRRVWRGRKLLGTIRAYDGFFLPTIAGAQLIKKHMKKVVISDPEAAVYVKRGKSVFAKFARTPDQISPGEEVAVYDSHGSLIAVGRALLSSEEIAQFMRGIAVEVRDYTQRT
jgi:7-cyano-7-deazaguanine tRNA-ribosyltransferase